MTKGCTCAHNKINVVFLTIIDIEKLYIGAVIIITSYVLNPTINFSDNTLAIFVH